MSSQNEKGAQSRRVAGCASNLVLFSFVPRVWDAGRTIFSLGVSISIFYFSVQSSDVLKNSTGKLQLQTLGQENKLMIAPFLIQKFESQTNTHIYEFHNSDSKKKWVSSKCLRIYQLSIYPRKVNTFCLHSCARHQSCKNSKLLSSSFPTVFLSQNRSVFLIPAQRTVFQQQGLYRHLT